MGERASTEHLFERRTSNGVVDNTTREVADEVPIAIEIDGLGYAVLMASPADLADLAIGFVLAERLADTVDDVIDLDIHQHAIGWVVRVTMSGRTAGRTTARVRHRTSESSCGLCGVENLEQAMRDLPKVQALFDGDFGAVFVALANLREKQPLNCATGAVHAAALCDRERVIRLVREDVGRHNALDKLIGAMRRNGLGWEEGFALMTSRCSYELVEKAALAMCPMLATISAPTSLAVARAAEAGLTLVSLARPDSLLLA